LSAPTRGGPGLFFLYMRQSLPFEDDKALRVKEQSRECIRHTVTNGVGHLTFAALIDEWRNRDPSFWSVVRLLLSLLEAGATGFGNLSS
jgi:hypothetical protein